MAYTEKEMPKKHKEPEKGKKKAKLIKMKMKESPKRCM
jgi:hypothetical protein